MIWLSNYLTRVLDLNHNQRLIILDRDGVLNRIIVHPEHGTINSPMNAEEVEIIAGVPESLKILNELGYRLCVATNQPAAAKGSTSIENLQLAHDRVIELAAEKGAQILSSHICFHRSEDKCLCRKPKPGLLQEAIARHEINNLSSVWMVGDGVTDIEAGKRTKVRTAFLGPRKCDACRVFSDKDLQPEFWGPDLKSFVEFLAASDN